MHDACACLNPPGPLCAKIEPWRSWPSISSCTPRRSSNGSANCSSMQPKPLAAERKPWRRWTCPAARQDRAAGLGECFFRGCAHQGGMAERKAMIDPEPRSHGHAPGRVAGHQPKLGVLPAAAGQRDQLHREGTETGRLGVGAGHDPHPDGTGALCISPQWWTWPVAACWPTGRRSHWRLSMPSR